MQIRKAVKKTILDNLRSLKDATKVPEAFLSSLQSVIKQIYEEN